MLFNLGFCLDVLRRLTDSRAYLLWSVWEIVTQDSQSQASQAHPCSQAQESAGLTRVGEGCEAREERRKQHVAYGTVLSIMD